jgi:hypothetical protein
MAQDFSRAFGGDFIVGGSKPSPWPWVAAAVGLTLIAVLFVIRK